MRAAFLLGAFILAGACNAGTPASVAGAGGGNAGGGQANAAGAQANRDFQVGAFDSINLTGASDVVVTVGGQPSVRAEGDAALIERLEIAVVEGELRIGMRPGNWSGDHRGVTVQVTVPSLQAAAIAGAGDMRIDHVQGHALRGDDRRRRRPRHRPAARRQCQFHAHRLGRHPRRRRGAAGQRHACAAPAISISTASRPRTRPSPLTGSGSVALRATGTATVQLSGVGNVDIEGSARCTVAKSGLGHVRCGGSDVS